MSALFAQIYHDQMLSQASTLAVRLSHHLPRGLAKGMEREFRPPTPKDATFAMTSACALGIPLPEAALEMTWGMQDFLADNLATYYRVIGNGDR